MSAGARLDQRRDCWMEMRVYLPDRQDVSQLVSWTAGSCWRNASGVEPARFSFTTATNDAGCTNPECRFAVTIRVAHETITFVIDTAEAGVPGRAEAVPVVGALQVDVILVSARGTDILVCLAPTFVMGHAEQLAVLALAAARLRLTDSRAALQVCPIAAVADVETAERVGFDLVLSTLR